MSSEQEVCPRSPKTSTLTGDRSATGTKQTGRTPRNRRKRREGAAGVQYRSSVVSLTRTECDFISAFVLLRDVAKAAKKIGISPEHGQRLYSRSHIQLRCQYECGIFDKQQAMYAANGLTEEDLDLAAAEALQQM